MQVGPGPRAASRLRTSSRRMVLQELSGLALSRADLVRRTGLARATVTSVVAELAAEGLVMWDGLEPSGRGRPSRLLRIVPRGGLVAAVDLGHAHLAVALADQFGRIITERWQPLDVDPSATDTLDIAAQVFIDTLRSCRDDGEVGVVALGVPGPLERRTGQLRSGTLLPGWAGIAPGTEFARRVGRPVVVENDANLCALGEFTYGSAQGHTEVLYIKCSSGIGSGLILDGRLYRGFRGTAGEIGHVQVDEDGALCRCGSRGCLETRSSTDFALKLLRESYGESLTLDGLLELVKRRDPAAVRVLTDMGTAIGRVVAAISANLDPEIIVVGGAIVDDPGPLLAGITAAVRRYSQPVVSAELQVLGGTLGARAGLLGGIALALASVSAG